MLFLIPFMVGAMVLLPLVTPGVDFFSGLNYNLAMRLVDGIGPGFKSLAVVPPPPSIAFSTLQAFAVLETFGEFNETLRHNRNSAEIISAKVFALASKVSDLTNFSNAQATQQAISSNTLEKLEKDLSIITTLVYISLIVIAILLVLLGAFCWTERLSQKKTQEERELQRKENHEMKTKISEIRGEIGKQETEQKLQAKNLTQIETSIMKIKDSKATDDAERERIAERIRNVHEQVAEILGNNTEARQRLKSTLTTETEKLEHVVQKMGTFEGSINVDLGKKGQGLETLIQDFRIRVDDQMEGYQKLAIQYSKTANDATTKIERAQTTFTGRHKALAAKFKETQDLAGVFLKTKQGEFKRLIEDAEGTLQSHIFKYKSLKDDAAASVEDVTEKISDVLGEAVAKVQDDSIRNVIHDLTSEVQASSRKLASLESEVSLNEQKRKATDMMTEKFHANLDETLHETFGDMVARVTKLEGETSTRFEQLDEAENRIRQLLSLETEVAKIQVAIYSSKEDTTSTGDTISTVDSNQNETISQSNQSINSSTDEAGGPSIVANEAKPKRQKAPKELEKRKKQNAKKKEAKQAAKDAAKANTEMEVQENNNKPTAS